MKIAGKKFGIIVMNYYKQDDYSVQEIIKRSNVKVICTTDDPTDDLALS